MNLKKFLRFLIMQNLILLTILQDVQAFSLHENSELVKTSPFSTSGEYIPQNLEGLLNKIETLISPLAFSLLLLLMLAYWSQAAFFGKEKYKTLNNFLFFFALTSLTLLLSVRWIISKHFPLSNLYESLVFLSLCFLSLKAIFLPRRKLTQKTKVLTKQSFVSQSPPVMGLNQVFQTNANPLKPALQNEIFNGAGEPLQKPALYEIPHNQNQRFNEPNLLNQGAKFFKGEIELGFSNQAPKTLDFSNYLPVEKKADFLDLGLGVILSPLSLLTFGFAFLSLPKEMQQSTALVPALQSNWLMMHVTVMILSYAALISGSILAIAFLILSYFESSYRFEEPFFFDEPKALTEQSFVSTDISPSVKKKITQPFQGLRLVFSKVFQTKGETTSMEVIHLNPNFQTNAKQDIEPRVKPLATEVNFSSLTARLDNYSYRILALGFPLLTIGILSGAVWANEAWGSYWSWDPKETWALITWLVFAIYLHTRITKGWSGKKPAIVASVGFFMVWFCYLGVNLLGSGLHSYGWFTKTFTG